MDGIINVTLLLVIIATIENNIVSGILVNDRSSCNLMYLIIVMKLGLNKTDKPYEGKNLLAFNDFSNRLCECINLQNYFRVCMNKIIMDVLFFQIPCESVYNIILGRSFLTMLDAFASIVHYKMKYH